MAAKYSFEMEKFLECPICLCQCEDPRVLPCLHSLCYKCLQQHVQTSSQEARFKCPSCRRYCDVPAGGLAALPQNFMLNTLRELLRKGTNNPEPHQIQTEGENVSQKRECANVNKAGTEHTEATVFCVDCTKFYCRGCQLSHALFDVLNEHFMRPVGEVNTKDVLAAEKKAEPAKCDQHRRLFIDMYCDTCSVPMCMKCCLLSHQQHKYRELDQKAGESRTELEEMKQTASNIMSSLLKRIGELETSQVNMEKDGKEICELFHKGAEELRGMITEHERSLVQTLQDYQRDAITEVRAVCKETELYKVAIQSLQSYIEVLLTSGDIIDQVTHSPGLHEQLHQLDTVSQQSVSWTVSLKKENRNLTLDSTILGDVSVDRPGTVGDDMRQTLADPVFFLKPDVGNYLAGLVVIADYLFVTGWCKPYLWVHNMRTRATKRHEIRDFNPVGMVASSCIDSSNLDSLTVVVADYYGKLHFVEITHEYMEIRKLTATDIPFEPRHVSVDSGSGKLIIANRSGGEIVVCDDTGKVEKRIKVKSPIRYMKAALAAGSGYITLDWSSPGKVEWVDQQGNTTVEHSQCHDHNLSRPWQMAQDVQGRLVITDRDNNRILLIDADRKSSHSLLEGIKSPDCICLDEARHRLFVGHMGNHDVTTISMYKWPFTLHKHNTLRVTLYK